MVIVAAPWVTVATQVHTVMQVASQNLENAKIPRQHQMASVEATVATTVLVSRKAIAAAILVSAATQQTSAELAANPPSAHARTRISHQTAHAVDQRATTVLALLEVVAAATLGSVDAMQATAALGARANLASTLPHQQAPRRRRRSQVTPPRILLVVPMGRHVLVRCLEVAAAPVITAVPQSIIARRDGESSQYLPRKTY